jgi:excisionase family DNA binding protein
MFSFGQILETGGNLMKQGHDEVSVREAAKSLSIRIGTVYQLLYDEVLSGRKDARGEWRVDAESVERYRLRRTVHRTASRAALQRDAIDVTATAAVGA